VIYKTLHFSTHLLCVLSDYNLQHRPASPTVSTHLSLYFLCDVKLKLYIYFITSALTGRGGRIVGMFFRMLGSTGQQAFSYFFFLTFRGLLLLDIYKCPHSYSVERILNLWCLSMSDIKQKVITQLAYLSFLFLEMNYVV
jgi:hypothetical protein